jgi:hypothetical protein
MSGYVVRVRTKKRQVVFQQLEKLIEEERAERASAAWFHGVLWAVLKVPPETASHLVREFAKIYPERESELKELLSYHER